VNLCALPLLPVGEKAIHVPDRKAVHLSAVQSDPYLTMNTTRESIVPPTGKRTNREVSQRPDSVHDIGIKRMI
jgi:hypothetical protein